MKKVIIFVVIIILLLGVGIAYKIIQHQQQKTVESIDAIQEREGIPVKTFTVTAFDHKETIAISGSIEPYQQVVIAPNLSERLVKLEVKAGERVQKGDVLARLDDSMIALQVEQSRVNLNKAREQLRRLKNGNRPEEIDMARSEMEQARYNLELLNTEYQRQKNLYEEQAATLQALDDVTGRRNAARAALETATARYELMQKGTREEDIRIAENEVKLAEVALQQTQKQLADHTLTAPIAGFVGIEKAEIGDMIDFMQPVFDLYEIRRVYLDINVSEIYLPKIAPGLRVELTVDALPGQNFTGTIDQINPAANADDRSFRTRILIDNEPYLLKPGMFARAHIVVRELNDALLIPGDAVKEDNGETYVFLVGVDKKAVRRKVRIGRRFKEMLEITDGLSEGEEVVTLSIDIKPGDLLLRNNGIQDETGTPAELTLKK